MRASASIDSVLLRVTVTRFVFLSCTHGKRLAASTFVLSRVPLPTLSSYERVSIHVLFRSALDQSYSNWTRSSPGSARMTRITRCSLFRPKYRVQVIRIIRGAIPSTASILILYRTGDKINERFSIYHWFPFVMIRNWGGQSRKRGYSFNKTWSKVQLR